MFGDASCLQESKSDQVLEQVQRAFKMVGKTRDLFNSINWDIFYENYTCTMPWVIMVFKRWVPHWKWRGLAFCCGKMFGKRRVDS
jgi:hypothetical protein